MFRKTALFTLAAFAAISFADGEFPSSNVKLIKHFDLETLQARSGNTCWGYVSPSGREYGLVGLSNKIAIVDVTVPAQARVVATVPHIEGMWADIKVYKNAVYVSSESTGSGIQVIDMTDIDKGEARLVKTIMSPGRSHTIAVDADGPYLYTCGSRDGTGTTTCFDIKEPLNPKPVGAPSLTPVYQHEAEVVTYKSGKYKGRTIFFGGGEGRGLEIWDVTDKDKPFLVRRVAYPFVGYCHQGWLSSDRKYFYVNDEFDESTNGIATRTLVFDVSDLDNADLVSTYSTGKSSIDHNLYTRNDFVFHANYTTGLWIFDANANPTNPRLCGYFDTFPQDDQPQFQGAWSNYPLLPSGIVLISDINRGLFIVDATEATKTPVKATDVKMEGAKGEMSTDALATGDDNGAAVSGKGTGTVVFEGKAPWQNPSKLSFELRGKASKGTPDTTLELYDWTAGKYDQMSSGSLGTSFGDQQVVGTKVARYIEAGTKRVRARLTIRDKGSWSAMIDKASWTVNP
ncbi:MAG: choice-of-anchor B family protein [Armatimonadetes bacterium]|nr:choice-of-anchor B family protein [Armatimonadota bacterium]